MSDTPNNDRRSRLAEQLEAGGTLPSDNAARPTPYSSDAKATAVLLAGFALVAVLIVLVLILMRLS